VYHEHEPEPPEHLPLPILMMHPPMLGSVFEHLRPTNSAWNWSPRF
jgi:hypothetical protein